MFQRIQKVFTILSESEDGVIIEFDFSVQGVNQAGLVRSRIIDIDTMISQLFVGVDAAGNEYGSCFFIFPVYRNHLLLCPL